MKITPVHTRIFKEKEDLPAFIAEHIVLVPEKTVLTVSSKLVALWKGKTVPYTGRTQKEELIRRESQAALQTPLAWLTIKDGMIMTNAGIDESNADGKLILLPPDCYACAQDLRTALRQKWNVQDLGVIITDSMILPLRAGIIGAAVAYSGFEGVKDLRGREDIFGKKLEVTLVDAADSLAAACALAMGEAAEQQPLCLAEGAPVAFVDGTNPAEIKYPPQNDLYTPLLKAVKLIK
ncbi:coenzyme F420-0:L-glutamate ligase [Candidatus Avelusimicrobium gallicola]|uniref:Coenzyme F420:L-glutamate ligase-like domain-containing protein n=1 Tax=Candidatus Avelusimicrobium gallicola TaxID=2562704 RepID=A0A1Y4DMP4_9BACT|nr:coenzyme F420-0:L-glutamate ligase [Elusimicrobium sp. An273]OUO57580.1 hypothetical protein B5F75_02055 [Elusimicrobium sp. An273]